MTALFKEFESEENFYLEHYDRLVGIFLRARYMFNKKKFLDE